MTKYKMEKCCVCVFCARATMDWRGAYIAGVCVHKYILNGNYNLKHEWASELGDGWWWRRRRRSAIGLSALSLWQKSIVFVHMQYCQLLQCRADFLLARTETNEIMPFYFVVVVAISGSVVLWTCQGRQPVVAGDLQKSCVLCTIFTLYHFILRYIVAFCDVYSTQTDRYRYYFRCPADLADQAKCLTWCMYVQLFFSVFCTSLVVVSLAWCSLVRLSSCISKEKEDKKTKQLPIHILIKLNISNKTGL